MELNGVMYPDPKQYWNNWKNDMSLFSATNQERPYEQLLHNWANNNNNNDNNNCLFTNTNRKSEKEIKEVIPF